jgi:hypothetical protein
MVRRKQDTSMGTQHLIQRNEQQLTGIGRQDIHHAQVARERKLTGILSVTCRQV